MSTASARIRTRQSSAQSVDAPLLLGLLGVLALLTLAAYGPLLAPHDPFETRSLYEGKPPPIDPGTAFPLGTDALGRDRLSWLLYGARTTFAIALAAAGVRVLVGFALGTVAASRRGAVELILSRVALAASSVPATVAACLAVLASNVRTGAIAFVIGLSIVGWNDVFHHMRRAVRIEEERGYVAAARSIGTGEGQILTRHVLPNIAPHLLTIAMLQISAVLLLLGELALLRLFIGGAVFTDLQGPPIVLPSEPEWASSLGTTRPVVDLYGNAISVLAPGAALLCSVVVFNLLGDALAHRAQQLDLYHLFTRRQWLAVMLGTAMVLLPALTWPGPLAAEASYAESFDSARALQEMRALMQPPLAARIAETPGADAAAAHLARSLHGTTVSLDETVARVQRATVAIGAHVLQSGPDLIPITETSASVEGRVVLARADRTVLSPRNAADFRGSIVLIRDPPSATAFEMVRVLAELKVAGVMLIANNDIPLDPIPSLMPAVRMSEAGAASLFEGRLPRIADGEAVRALDLRASLEVRVSRANVRGKNAVATLATTRENRPVVLVIAPFDLPTTVVQLPNDDDWATASAAAVLIAVAERARSERLAAELVFVAAASQSQDQAGLKTALRTLASEQRERLAAVIVMQDALGGVVSIRSDASGWPHSGAARMSARVASRAGATATVQPDNRIQRALAATGMRVPTLELVTDGPRDREPSAVALERAGRTLLLLVAYLASHPDQLRD